MYPGGGVNVRSAGILVFDVPPGNANHVGSSAKEFRPDSIICRNNFSFFLVQQTNADQIIASALIEHCAGPNRPDGICLGYMEAALDFITEYQLWLLFNGYKFPPGDKSLCVEGDTSAYNVAAVFVAWMQRHQDGWRPASAVAGDAIREAFACRK
jgi:hypothetical protein